MPKSRQPTKITRTLRPGVYRVPYAGYWTFRDKQQTNRLIQRSSFDNRTFINEDFTDDTATDGTTLSSTNTLFDLFNSPGTSVFRFHPYASGKSGTLDTVPVFRDGCAEYATDTRVTKSTNELPGTTNGGQPLQEWYTRFYFMLTAAPSTISRIAVMEQSVANGGADIACIRVNTSGAFQVMDGASAGTATTRTGIGDWTRIEWYCSRRTQTQDVRLFWGQNLNNSDITAYNERATYTLATTGDPETFGTGIYTGTQATAKFRFSCLRVATGTWIGPELGVRPRNSEGFGTMLKSKLAA